MTTLRYTPWEDVIKLPIHDTGDPTKKFNPTKDQYYELQNKFLTLAVMFQATLDTMGAKNDSIATLTLQVEQLTKILSETTRSKDESLAIIAGLRKG